MTIPETRRRRESDELDRLLERRRIFSRLSVPDQAKGDFARYEAESRRRCVLVGIWLGLLIYPAFVIADLMLMPDVLGEALVMRFGIATPLMILALWLVKSRRVAGQLMEWIVVFMVWLGATLTSTMIVSSVSPQATMSFSYNNILLVFLAVVFQPAVSHYILSAALVIVTTGTFAWLSPHFEIGFWVYYVSGACTTAAVGLYATWSFVEHRTLRFLTARRDGLRLEELAEQNRFLEQLSVIEPLTGLSNRRGFERALEASLQKAAERGGIVAVAMIDIDFFKRFNDSYGHPAGDECLRQVAAAIGSADNGRHFTARLGGEEFAVILSEVDRRILPLLGERLRHAVAALDIPHATHSRGGRVTISLGIGYALFGPGLGSASPSVLVDAADAALYEAKRGGRDRVVVAEPVEALALTG